MNVALNPIPEKTVNFLEQQHLLSLTTYSPDTPKLWAANCFYVILPDFSAHNPALYFMSEMHTEHAKRMIREPEVAGTISVNTMDVKQIEGIQFLGECRLLTSDENYQAVLDKSVLETAVLDKYCERFPIARVHQAPLWELQLSFIKFTSNREKFGEKLYWKTI